VSWLDRITGTVQEAPTSPLVTGQWRYLGTAPLAVRKAKARSEDLLIAGEDGRLQARSLVGLRVDPAVVPDRTATQTVRSMGRELRSETGRSWLDWLDRSPLMPPLEQTLAETELEQQVSARLGCLEEVCRAPRTHLKLEEERQPVSRCKRPAPRALAVLAARSEDWDRRTLFGIRPRRVVGLVRDDLFDLYENRLAVVLVDRLDEALAERVREVRRLVHAARSMQDWSARLQSGRSHRRAHRMCELWGQLWQGEGFLEHALAALKRLRRLRKRVLGLKDTVLYRRIGGRRRRIELRMTNVLTHDDIYRGVAELWIVWQLHARPVTKTPQDRWDEDQDAARGFDLFTVLLIVRALDFLRYEPREEDLERRLLPGARVRLDGPGGNLDLVLDSDEGLRLESEGGAALPVVGLLATLSASVDPLPWLRSCCESSALVVHLEADAERGPLEGKLRLRGPGPMAETPMLVPVAPWELESVERVARALRWWIWRPLFSSYPVRVPLPRRGWAPTESIPDWIAVEAEVIRVSRPSGGSGWSALETRIRKERQQVAGTKERMARLNPRKPRDKAKLKGLKAELAGSQRSIEEDEAVQGGLDEAVSHLGRLLACPVCEGAATPWTFEQDGDLFRATCAGCGARWGLLAAACCGGQVPFLETSDGEAAAVQPLDVDAACGCDVLAFPVELGVYLCPECGRRTDGEGDDAA
jgi:hypothetical protein